MARCLPVCITHLWTHFPKPSGLHTLMSWSFDATRDSSITPVAARTTSRTAMEEDAMRAAGVMIVALAGLSPGCATDQTVRYVYQDKEFGVVGMPENTDKWPTHYRRRAEKLMAKHFPEGHEIVRAEEVVQGSRTLKIEGSKTAEITPQIPAEILKIAKLGRSASRSQSDVVKIKECRIIYHRAAHAEATGFSTDVEVTPARYLDPNDAERKKADAGPGKSPEAESHLARSESKPSD